MTDIVKRLRGPAPHMIGPLMDEAADEIERLRTLKTPASRHLLNITKGCLDDAEAEVARLQSSLDAATKYWPKDAGEIERLRAMDWREIARRLWDGDYASVDELAKAMEHEMRGE